MKGLEMKTIAKNDKGTQGFVNYGFVNEDTLILEVKLDKPNLFTTNGAGMYGASYLTVKAPNGNSVRMNCQFYESISKSAKLDEVEAENAKLRALLAELQAGKK